MTPLETRSGWLRLGDGIARTADGIALAFATFGHTLTLRRDLVQYTIALFNHYYSRIFTTFDLYS